MHGSRSHHGARHRFLILMYLTCFILSLTPTISAPPERGFNQGQPEMHQAMDNMVAHGILMKKTGVTFPATDDPSNPALLTSKTTSSLLNEAEHVISTLKDSKEKQWFSAFVQRMTAIAEMLEKAAEKSKLHSSDEHNSLSGTPVPKGLPSQPTWTAATAVPGSNPFQKSSKMMSKFPVTSPELSQVLPVNVNPSESQVITTPAALSNKQDEDDELVRELESLHKEVSFEVPVQNPKVQDTTPIFTSPAPIATEGIEEAQINKEKDKAYLKAKLLREIAEYQRLGGMPNEIINALNEEKQITAESTSTLTKDANKPEAIGNSVSDKAAANTVEEIKHEEKKISEPNPKSLELQTNYSNPGVNQFPQMKVNYPHVPAYPRFGNQFQHMPLQSNGQPYQRVFGYGAGNFYRPNPFNFHGNYQAIGSTNQQFARIPDALRQRMLQPQDMVYNPHPGNYNNNENLAKTRYDQYPQMQHWQNKNSTFDLKLGAPPHSTRPLVNHQIDTQLNDEMKRQLRDGKIVVLSDSLVRTNFQPGEIPEDKHNKIKQPNAINEKKNHNSDAMDDKKNGTPDVMNDKKNVTQTLN